MPQYIVSRALLAHGCVCVRCGPSCCSIDRVCCGVCMADMAFSVFRKPVAAGVNRRRVRTDVLQWADGSIWGVVYVLDGNRWVTFRYLPEGF